LGSEGRESRWLPHCIDGIDIIGLSVGTGLASSFALSGESGSAGRPDGAGSIAREWIVGILASRGDWERGVGMVGTSFIGKVGTLRLDSEVEADAILGLVPTAVADRVAILEAAGAGMALDPTERPVFFLPTAVITAAFVGGPGDGSCAL